MPKIIIPTSLQRKMLAIALAGGLSLSAAFSAVFLTVPSEGKVNAGYVDPGGVVTACYGHTGPEVKLGNHYTDPECFALLLKDEAEAEVQVKSLIDVPLNTYQLAALDDFVYNEGAGRLKSSTMRKKFNSGNYKGGCDQLVRWVIANGKKLGGLVKRRDKEMAFCLGQVEVKYNAN